MKGKYFNQVGAVRYSLNDLDAAFCAYTSASIWYERGKEYRLRADVENNIALLKLSCGMYADAHEHLNNAFVGCNDEVAHAQIDETRARVCLAEGHPREALEYALASAVTLKDADEKRLLFESLETLAKVYDMLKREGSMKRSRALWKPPEAG